MESSEMISTSPSRSATSSASADFPDAVGPTNARWVTAARASPRSAGGGTAARAPARGLARHDRDARPRAGEGRCAHGVHAGHELAAQPVRGGIDDPHVDVVTGPHRTVRCEVHELALPGP